MFLQPEFIAFLGAMSTLFIWMGLTRPRRAKFDTDEMRNYGIYTKIHVALLRAGLTETSPMLVITGTIIGMTLMLFFVALIVGNVYAGMAASILTPVAVYLWLYRQQRKYYDRINAALVPFLRQMEANVTAQQNASQAFIHSVEKSPLFSHILRDKMNELRLNRPFIDVLLETKALIPVRGWLQFVKAMEIQSESGGNLADTIKSAVGKIQSRLLLQETIRGSYRTIAGQQKIIVGAGIAIPVFFYFTAPSIFENLTSSIIGVVGLLGGITLILLGMLLGRQTVKDIEEKIHY